MHLNDTYITANQNALMKDLSSTAELHGHKTFCGILAQIVLDDSLFQRYLADVYQAQQYSTENFHQALPTSAIKELRSLYRAGHINIQSVISRMCDMCKPERKNSFRRCAAVFHSSSDTRVSTSSSNVKITSFSKCTVLYGPPGTGKTRKAKILAAQIVASPSNQNGIPSEEVLYQQANQIISGADADHSGQIKLVQFHPSYSYFDFVEGIEAGTDGFRVKSKIFRNICVEAQRNTDKKYVLIIDEINRANVAAVLGELLYGLENRNDPIHTSIHQVPLTVPDNLHVIGTMNTVDQSISSMDYAVRRRFSFEFVPSEVPKNLEQTKYFCEALYTAVKEDLAASVAKGVNAQDIMPGMSYFLTKKSEEGPDIEYLKYKIKYELCPLLIEYAKNGLLSKRRQLPGEQSSMVELLQSKKYEEKLMKLADRAENGGTAN